jgi:hypothetical protein
MTVASHNCLERQIPSPASEDPLLQEFTELGRLHAEGKFDEARALFQKIRSREPDAVTPGPTEIVHRRKGRIVLREIEGGLMPLPSAGVRKKPL